MIVLNPTDHISELYVKKQLASLLLEQALPATPDSAKANALNEQFQSVFTDEDMQNLTSCKILFPDMSAINFDIDGVIKQLHKFNTSKTNGLDNTPVRILEENSMECKAMFIICFVSYTSMAYCHIIGLIPLCALFTIKQDIRASVP